MISATPSTLIDGCQTTAWFPPAIVYADGIRNWMVSGRHAFTRRNRPAALADNSSGEYPAT
jgi:hypothetical protein